MAFTIPVVDTASGPSPGRDALKNTIRLRNMPVKAGRRAKVSVTIAGDVLAKIPAPIGSFVAILLDDNASYTFLIRPARANEPAARRVGKRGESAQAGHVTVTSSGFYNLNLAPGEFIDCEIEKHPEGVVGRFTAQLMKLKRAA